MSALAFKRREKKIERLYFIPAGTTVDGAVVAKTTGWPDNVPTSNFTDFEFDAVENLKQDRTTEKETFKVPGNTGYVIDEDEIVLQQAWSATTHASNAIIKMLQYGFATIPVANTPQVPRARKENYIDGLLLKETQLVSTGAVTERLLTWARLTVTDFGESADLTSKVICKFAELESSSNSAVIIA